MDRSYHRGSWSRRGTATRQQGRRHARPFEGGCRRAGEAVTSTGRDPQQRYEICVHCHLGDTIRSAFPDLEARERGGDTTLSGVFADQAALYGVLAQIERLGLELIEVRRLPSG
jgi:hypothetical protein